MGAEPFCGCKVLQEGRLAGGWRLESDSPSQRPFSGLKPACRHVRRWRTGRVSKCKSSEERRGRAASWWDDEEQIPAAWGGFGASGGTSGRPGSRDRKQEVWLTRVLPAQRPICPNLNRIARSAESVFHELSSIQASPGPVVKKYKHTIDAPGVTKIVRRLGQDRLG